jgi:UDP-N-acetylglucosamine 2-epimerase (non-hydrolysing)
VVDSITFLGKSGPGSATGKSERSVLVTLHRREAAGQTRRLALARIFSLAQENPELQFSLVSHPNPSVLQDIEAAGKNIPINVRIVQPLSYEVFLDKFRAAICLISDSGGVQEEGPTLGTPVLIARNNTERPEGISSGHNFLIGADAKGISDGWEWLSSRPIPDQLNPFGDGTTSEKVAAVVSQIIR